MLQILVWGVCFVIIGLGYCGTRLAQIAEGAKKKETTGMAIFLIMIFGAVGILVLSLLQGNVISDLLKR